MAQVIHTDIFIAGAGPAGIAAAVAAAELGLNVCLAEKNSFPGGRATASAVGTICGLYLRSRQSAEFAMNGFPKRFAEKLLEFNRETAVPFSEGLWFLPAHPSDFEKTAKTFLEKEGIQVHYNTAVGIVRSTRERVTEVHCIKGGEILTFAPECVIDCSGEGVVCSLLDHSMISDEEFQAAAIVFSLKNVLFTDEFQLSCILIKNMIRHIEDGKAPSFINLLGVIPDSLRDGKVHLKMGLPWKIENNDLVSINEKARDLVPEVWQFLKIAVPGFENCEVEWVAPEVGVRTGKRAMGKNLLTGEHVLSLRKTNDAICNGAWPIEYWRTGNRQVDMTFLPEGEYYSIPAGCLESGEKENLFFAGKIISAEEKAIASARVIGTCLGTGFAAGVLASYMAMKKNRGDAVEYIRKQMLDMK